ncbi:transposable element Tcb2 transposase [Trichonephila clavipes]|nr:transposable element Tcb2 transposase [Trichonephila clavipes]
MRKCWDQWIPEKSFTRRPGSGRPRKNSRREDPPTSRRLAEGHLGSRPPLRVLPLTPTYRRLRLEWCRARRNSTEAEKNQVVFCDESRFNLSTDDNRVRVWRPRVEHLNPAFALQRPTVPTAEVTVSRRLYGRGLFVRRPVVCVPISSANKRVCLKRSRDNRHWSVPQWMTVHFTDESRFKLTDDSCLTFKWKEP